LRHHGCQALRAFCIAAAHQVGAGAVGQRQRAFTVQRQRGVGGVNGALRPQRHGGLVANLQIGLPGRGGCAAQREPAGRAQGLRLFVSSGGKSNGDFAALLARQDHGHQRLPAQRPRRFAGGLAKAGHPALADQVKRDLARRRIHLRIGTLGRFQVARVLRASAGFSADGGRRSRPCGGCGSCGSCSCA